MAEHSVTYAVSWKPASVWVSIPSGSVLDVSGTEDVGGNPENPFGFGEPPSSRWAVKLIRTAINVYTQAWKRRPIRTTITVDGVPTTVLNGILTAYDGSSGGDIAFACETMVAEISTRSRNLYSLGFEDRYVATETTATSIEDPTDPSYEGGPINWGFWMTGGRPLEQAGTYPNADYYYSCDFALIAPRVTWFAGEDSWQVMLDLVQASGGRIYQDSAGVMRYEQVLSIVDDTPAFTLAAKRTQTTDDLWVFRDAKDSGSTAKFATKFTCSHIERQKRPMQEIIRHDMFKDVPIGGNAVLTEETQWPLASLDAWAEDDLIVATHAGVRIWRSSGGYTTTTSFAAQRIVVTVHNTMAEPLIVYRLVMRGEPYLAVAQGRVEVGVDGTQREYGDNPFIGTEEHATQLCTMALPFYAGQPTIQVSDAPMDTRRFIGETGYIYDDQLSLAGDVCVITGRDIRNIDTVQYTLALPGDVPVANDFFIVSTTNYTGLSKWIAW